MSEREFDTDSLIPGTPTAGQPPRPAGPLPEDAYTVEILRTAADGTQTLNSATQASRYPSELQSASFPIDGPPVLTLAPRDAAMLGLARMILGMRFHATDLQVLLESGASQTRVSVHKIERVHLDWPTTQQESMPSGNALITGPDESPFQPSGRQARLLTETADRFHPNTMLRYLGEDQEIPLQLIIWTAHKDQRRGLEAKIAKLLAAEVHDDRTGRRIILPEYFSRVIRYTMTSTTRPDSAEGARGNEWILSVAITAEVPHVELVWSPGYVDRVIVGTEVAVGSDGELLG